MDAAIRLLEAQNSPDNNTRKQAELDFIQWTRLDPSHVCSLLFTAASLDEVPVALRQSALLHLRRLVPQFWSLAFQSFVGPPIHQEIKLSVRSGLLDLALTTSNSKLRAATAYVIVQIAASDYPDEWQDLLPKLYQLTTQFENPSAMVGGLSVLNDLFDDLISEEQFWDAGVGAELTNHVNGILSHDSLSLEIRSTAIKLYHSILNTLQGPEAFSNKTRKKAVQDHIRANSFLLSSLLAKSAGSFSLAEILYRTQIYKTLVVYYGNFNSAISQETTQETYGLVLKDLQLASKKYNSVVVTEGGSLDPYEDVDPKKTLSTLLIYIFRTLSVIQNAASVSSLLTNDQFVDFAREVVQVSFLPEETIALYEADFNEYVTDISGLAGTQTVRDAVNEFLSEINDLDARELFSAVLVDLQKDQSWESREAHLFVIESLLMNEEADSIGSSMPLLEVLQSLQKFACLNNTHLVTARVFLLLPKFFEKFNQKMSVETVGVKSFIDMVTLISELGNGEDTYTIKYSALVSIPFYKQLMKWDEADKTNLQGTQLPIFQTIFSLMDDSEDDSLAVLLEALTTAIDINHVVAAKATIGHGVSIIELIFKISFKDAANVQLAIGSSECVTMLLQDLSLDDYLRICEKSLPFVFELIQSVLATESVEYSSQLDLALEFFSRTIDSAPKRLDDEDNLPAEIFNHAFPILNDLLLRTTDDQILQSGGEVFNNLLQKAPKSFVKFVEPSTGQPGINLLLSIASKFLSPELSDSAAMNCGSIVLSLIENFQSHLGADFLSQLIEATVRRLIIAKEVITIENLIMVFCKLVLTSSAKDTIDFLSNSVRIDNPKTGSVTDGLQAVLPIWFNSFEITRGYEKIKQNTLALGKIFTLGDERVENLIVDGDIIPYQGDAIRTRSMAAAMPDQYTQISASHKILKLLLSELKFQYLQPNAEDYLPEAENDDDEEGWEDMEDIGVPNYDKLKSYVESEDEHEDDFEDQTGDGGLKNLLVLFFKESLSKDLGHFQKFYEMLDDDEKKVLTENVVF